MKQAQRRDGFISILATMLAVTELLGFIVCVIVGEVREFLSAELQTFVFGIALAITIYLQFVGPQPASPNTQRAHAGGCRLCGEQDAIEYATEYGWYETTVGDSGAVKETKKVYLPLGVARVLLCDTCVSKESTARIERERRIAGALALIGVPVLMGAAYLLGGFSQLGLGPPDLSVDGRGFAWLAAIVAAIMLVLPALQLLSLIEAAIPNARAKRTSEFARIWSWELVRDEITSQFESEATEEQLHGLRITKTAGIGPKVDAVDSWERQPATVRPRYRRR